MNKKPQKPTVYAYGFDKLGFATPEAPEEELRFILKFVGYESECSLAEADGLVIPSGIFEDLYVPKNFNVSSELKIRYDTDLLAAREKQLFNAFKRGTWTAFLIQKINNGEYANWTQTDLAKKFLNRFAKDVKYHKPNPYVTCTADEFCEYLDRFGVAQTSFSAKDQKGSTRVLAHENDTPVGLEAKGQFFFLPFFTTKCDKTEIADAVRFLVNSVLDYKGKNDIYLPAWVNALRFKSEVRIQNEVQLAEERLIKLSEEAKTWERFKAVLCTSGQNLNVVTVAILREFFGLTLKSEEKFIEDAVIFSPGGQVKYVVEIKGVNGGIKRENINQVDSHRDRLGIGPEIPGLLIVNDFMDVEDFNARKAKVFDTNNLTHAKNNNVKVLRAVTLFECMLELEERQDRQAAFFELCDSANPLVEIATK